jgi:uncharacterized surface protein with fasciclin (FAS1) repeats
MERKTMPDIVDLAISGKFNTLVAAVKAAGLVDTLKSPGPFTVFAPTDEAFAKLPAGTVEGLLKDIPKLKNILLFHVVPGKLMAADVVKLKTVKTVQGQELKVDAVKWHLHKNVKINNADIIKTDIVASNGVCHAIDTVLIPK